MTQFANFIYIMEQLCGRKLTNQFFCVFQLVQKSICYNFQINSDISFAYYQQISNFIKILHIQHSMQNQKQIVHIYGFDQNQYSSDELAENIAKALKPYYGNQSITPADIKVRGKPTKFWAFVAVDQSLAQKLNKLHTIEINGKDIHIGRYYHDYQIFINKLDSKIESSQLKQYMSKFGKVIDLVITEPADKKNADEFKHCYIKVSDQQTANKIILQKKHKIGEIELRVVRTFKLDQDKDSDRKLFLKIQGILVSAQNFQQKAIEYFKQFGSMREKPKIQYMSNNKSKIIITYTNAKYASAAIQKFESSEWYSQAHKQNIKMTLRYFLTKQNKIFVPKLNQNVTQKDLYECFSAFGEVSDASINNRMKKSAVIGFADEQGYKLALSNFPYQPKIKKLFTGKPYITVYMTQQQKKSFNQMKNKSQKPQVSYYPPHNMMMPMPPMNYGQGFIPGKNPPPPMTPQQGGYPGPMIQGAPMGANSVPPNKYNPPPMGLGNSGPGPKPPK